MIEPYPATVPNARKQFVKCVDCHCQTLPQNAALEGPWVPAATLSIRGRVNDGVLCAKCANARRKLLGLPLPAEATDEQMPSCRAATQERLTPCTTALKNIRINNRDYRWEIGSLESLVSTWCTEVFPSVTDRQASRFLLVAVNNVRILTKDFASTPIADGDEISILVGGKF